MRGGEYVLMARHRGGLTQRELANRLGLRQATIARWERGDRQVGMEDVEAVASACGLQLEAHLAAEDRSWWSQIAVQLELDPLERVRRLTPPGAGDLVVGLTALGAVEQDFIVMGEVAGALQGSPLMLAGDAITICAESIVSLTDIGRRLRPNEYEVPGGARLRVLDRPPGTQGLRDLRRSADPIDVEGGELRVASVLDLLRVADASDHRSARLEALAYRAVLDVRAAQTEAHVPDGRTSTEKIDTWLKQQTPVTT